MRPFIIVLLCMTAKTAFCQEKKTDVFKHILNLRENTIYIFCRGTVSKPGVIAHQFNLMDTNITHVGIGFVERNNTRIYNVSDNGNMAKSALVIDSPESYINIPEAFYFSVWQCNSSQEDFNRLKVLLKQYSSGKVVFDAFFRINDDDTLYCSEFCALVLAKTNIKKYSFKPSEYLLNNVLYETYLCRKKLVYYPVDFFEKSSFFKMVFSYRFD